MIDQTNVLLLERVENIKDEVQLTAEFIKGSIHSKAEIFGQDSDYVQFLINILRTDRLLTAISIATPEGDLLNVANVHLESSLHFYSRPDEKLPEKSEYIVRTIHQQDSSSQEEWKYMDADGNFVASESIIPASDDFRKNSWLLKMLKEPSLLWAYELLPRGVPKYEFKRAYSVTVSDVKKNSEGDVDFVLSVGVTLKNLSNFIAGQKIGKNGFAFILDDKGSIKAPLSNEDGAFESCQKPLIELGYQEFKKNQKNDFTMKKNGVKYLFSIQDSGIFQADPWFIAIVVPFDDFFGEMVKAQRITRLMSLIIAIVCAVVIYFCVRHISKPIVRMVAEVDKIRDFDFSEQSRLPSHIKEIFDLECSIDAMRSALHSFGRYIPKEIVRTLVKFGRDVSLGGERAELTIMFSDIENFTTISESLPIEQLMTIFSEYFDVISKIILEGEGTIDKYIGDSVMSFWGAPVKIVNHAEKACLSGLRALAAIRQQKKWTTRFGIHTGEVIVGNIGTSERMNYTIIGDAVNVASRLQSINKEYHTSIIITEVVRQKIGGAFLTRPLDFVAVKGRKSKLRIFELMGTREGELAATSEQLELAGLFTNAYQKFEEGNRGEALDCFLFIEKKFPSDGATKKYIERLRSML